MKKWAKTAGLLLLMLTLTACSPFRKDVFEVQPLEKSAAVANRLHEAAFYHVKGRTDYSELANPDLLENVIEYELWYSEGDCLLLCSYPGAGGTYGEMIWDGQCFVSDRLDGTTVDNGMRWKQETNIPMPDVWLRHYGWEELEKGDRMEIRPSALGWRLSIDVSIPFFPGRVPRTIQDQEACTVYFYLNGSGKFEKLVTSSSTGWVDTMTIEKTTQKQIEERIDKEYKRASAQETLSFQKDQLIDIDKFEFFSEILTGDKAREVTTACKALLRDFQEKDSYHIRVSYRNTGEDILNETSCVDHWKSGENWMHIARTPQDGILDGLPALASVYASLDWNGECFSTMPGPGTDREWNILWSPSENEKEYPPEIYTLDMDATHAAYAAGSLQHGCFGVMFRGEVPEAWGEGYGKEYALGFYFTESGELGCLTLKTTGNYGSEQTVEILSTDPEKVSAQIEAEYQKAIKFKSS